MRSEDGSDLVTTFLGESTALGGGMGWDGVDDCVHVFKVLFPVSQTIVPRRVRRDEDDTNHCSPVVCSHACSV